MSSDRAKISYDENQHYRSVVMQQGRVTLEADWNEQSQIVNEEMRKEALDFVGSSGTPDNGYAVSKVSNSSYDLSLSPGTLYVDGMRLGLDKNTNYGNQDEWVDTEGDPFWVNVPEQATSNEYVYLLLREQEISAVEDPALLEVALGGPDTAARTRLIQRIVRTSTNGNDCPSALSDLEANSWAHQGLTFDPASLRLQSKATLTLGFDAPSTTTDPCQPQATGGYLGAENQLIRVKISTVDTRNNQYKLVWGYDNASFLSRVTAESNSTKLILNTQPVDSTHQPQKNQAVEILRTAAKLSNGEYVAAADGFVTLVSASYNPDFQSVELPASWISEYSSLYSSTPQIYLRVWQEEIAFVPGTAVKLNGTGLTVTMTADANGFHVGDFWLFAVRPGTSTQVFPQRYNNNAPQLPDGPRLWACPLALINWKTSYPDGVLDCRNHFDNLVELSKRRSSGCCTVSLSPGDLTESKTLQTIINGLVSSNQPIKICLSPGEYVLSAPLILDSRHSHLCIEACPGGATIRAQPGSESKSSFQQGLITLSKSANVSLRGLTLVMPLAAYTLGSTDTHISIGLRPVNCAQLSVEDCTFIFPGALPGHARTIVSAGIFAGGECIGLRLTGNRFEGAAATNGNLLGFQIGFSLYSGSLVAGATRGFLGSWLDEALLRDNIFDTLTLAVLGYADCGLVNLESNTVRNCACGFMFLSLPILAYEANLAQVSIAKNQVQNATTLHNGLYSILANPAFQNANAVLRGFPLTANYSPDNLVKLTNTHNTTLMADISGLQHLYEQALPTLVATASATTKAPASQLHTTTTSVNKLKLNDQSMTLATHPWAAFHPVSMNLVKMNETYSLIEKQAYAKAVSRKIPLSLRFVGNDVQAQAQGGLSGFGLLVVSLGTDDRDTVNLSTNRFISASPLEYIPVATIFGSSCCTVTGNTILNEITANATLNDIYRNPIQHLSLVVAPRLAAVAITGNVLRGHPLLPVRTLASPLNHWDYFNSIT